jgi:glycosyltransferase involved in cell wall biosynthesis
LSSIRVDRNFENPTRERGAAVELHPFGAPDPSNRRAIPEADLRQWAAQPGIHWHGATTDIACIWAEHHAAILLSYREGLPRSLVEAAAAGRPIIREQRDRMP